MTTAAAAFTVLVVVFMTVAAAALAFMVVVMVTAAAFTFVRMRVIVPAAAAFTVFMLVFIAMTAAAALAFVVVVMVTAAAFTFVRMRVIVPAAAAFTVFVLVFIAVTAAAALAFVVVVMMVTAAAFAFMIVMMATAALVIMMMVVAATAAAAVMAAAAARFNKLNRIERRFDRRHGEPHHTEHLRKIRQRQHGEPVGRLRDAHAAVDERRNGFTHHIDIARHMQNLFDGRLYDPESTRIVYKDIAHFERAHFFDRNAHFTGSGGDRLGALGALGRSKHEAAGSLEDDLRGRSTRREKLR